MKNTLLYNTMFIWTIPKIVVLAIFARFSCFGIIRIPGLEGYSVCLMTLFLCIFYSNRIIEYFKKYPSYYFIGVVFIFAAQIIYTYNTYGQNPLDTFKSGMHWLFILLYPFIIYIFEKDRGIHKLMKIICFLAFISSTILILQAILFNNFGIHLIDIGENPSIRNNRLRIDKIKDLFNLMILYCFFIFYCKQKVANRFIFQIYFLFGICTIFYVAQVRMLYISLLLYICATLFIANKGTSKKIIFILCFIAAISFAYSTGIISKLLDSFSVHSSEDGNSTLFRIQAIGYYYETFFVEHPIMGMGWLFVDIPEFKVLKHGEDVRYHIVDIGFLGLLFELGLLGAIFYISILLRFAYILFKNYNKKIREYPFLFGMFVYLITTSGSLIITDIFRIFMLPFCIAIFEYVHNRERGRLCIA